MRCKHRLKRPNSFYSYQAFDNISRERRSKAHRALFWPFLFEYCPSILSRSLKRDASHSNFIEYWKRPIFVVTRRTKEKQNFQQAFLAIPYKRHNTLGKDTVLIITYKDRQYPGCIIAHGTINKLDISSQQEPFFPFPFLYSKDLENTVGLSGLSQKFSMEKTKSYLSKTPILIPVHIQCIRITTQSVFPLKRKNKYCSNI